MKKNKKPFFAKHAKSSAMLVSLGIHALVILVAITFVAFTVITKEEKVFVAKENKRPKMKLKKLQVPIKMEKRKKTTPKLRRRVVAKKSRRPAMDVALPELSGVMGGMGAMNVAGGLGSDIGFSMPEINFFGVKKKSEKVVFIVLAGPASTRGADRRFSPKSRMCFHTLRARLNEMVHDLPEYALFNASFFMAELTTPFSTNMLLATEENKAKMTDWASTVNPLELEETYSRGDRYEGFFDRFLELDWYKGEVMTNNIPPVYPKWVYNYKPGPHLMKHYIVAEREEREFMHVNRAICFALEQKPDTIFILSTNYIGNDSADNVQSYMKICNDIYGPDRSKYPTINVVLMERSGANPEG
ncbi:MAG: hypothetical protein KJN98_08400, partial [Pontiella sp.]|nr:hypothetical protein [Pontiella sp.]